MSLKWTSGGSVIQSYKISSLVIEPGTYFIQNKETEKYVDIENQAMTNGTQIHQWEFHYGLTQHWSFQYLSDGYFYISSANGTGYYLGVSGDSTVNNSSVILRTGAITNGMRWRVEKNTNGSYKIIPKTGSVNGLVLATAENSCGDGVDICQKTYVYDSNYTDEWYLIQPTEVIESVPTNLRSNSTHLCVPCAITNIASYWCVDYGYSQFGCATVTEQESKAAQVQTTMQSAGPGYHQDNQFVQYGFDVFQHVAGNSTYSLYATNYFKSNNEVSFELVETEISALRPCLLGFANTSDNPYGGAHMTVCVGYDTNNGLDYVYVSDAHISGFRRWKFSPLTYSDFISAVDIYSY